MKAFGKALILALILLLCMGQAVAEEPKVRAKGTELRVQLNVEGGRVELCVSEMAEEWWLFLPAFADRTAMQLTWQGSPVEWTDEGETLEVQLSPEDVRTVNVMQSENLRAFFLVSDDPVNEGRAFIENCPRHENRTTASYALVSAGGRIDHGGDVRQLRGRGNGTWGGDGKKPYQIKLETKADLLDTGLAEEVERTWLLLADVSDATFLRNRITMDMGLELGLSHTSHTEHIDLYYDGEYRGLYLLCEKSEIGEGRVDERDYDDLIEAWNNRVGQTDLEQLPVGTGQNRFGNPYTYIEGVAESGSPDAGAYFLEMEVMGTTLSDRCYFALEDGSILASKNPENASQTMMDYISTRLQEARDTLENGGVNPENGRTIHDDFDVDAFARTMLVQELSYNYDGYKYSSSFFVLPAGEKRFIPGPLWDFDIAYRYLAMGQNAQGVGFKEANGWMHAFYQCPEFVNAAREIYETELYPMVQTILLGQAQGEYLKPLAAYAAEIEASRQMNDVLWDAGHLNRYVYALDHAGELDNLRRFLAERSEWMRDAFASHTEDDTTVLWLNAVYAHVNETVRLLERPWNSAVVEDLRFAQFTEATEEDYAIWGVECLLKPKAGAGEPTVWVNGINLPCEAQEDGRYLIRLTFEDPSYRPVDYYGDDIGIFYNPEFYAQAYPEVAEACEYDPDMMMDSFCDDGMYEDHMGNAFFRPSEVLAAYPAFINSLGEDWQNYYWDFLYYGYQTDKWLLYMGKGFYPAVENAL